MRGGWPLLLAPEVLPLMDIQTESAKPDSMDRDQATDGDEGGIRARTREAILDTALRLYRHSGYSGVTIRALGKEMGLKAPSLYHYFDSKEEMFVLLQRRALSLQEALMLEELTDDPLADLEIFFVRYVEFAEKYPEYFTLLYIDPAAPASIKNWSDGKDFERLRDATHIRIQRCVEAGTFPDDVDEETVANLLWHAALGPAVLRRSVPQREHVPEADLTGIRFVIEGTSSGILRQREVVSSERSPWNNGVVRETKDPTDLHDD